MDFLDPSNMLWVWKSGGRHSWSNPDFDAKLKEASEYLGDPSERITMFQEAERILVEDVPAVFVYHGTRVQFIKPWLKGDFMKPDKNGIAAMHWPATRRWTRCRRRSTSAPTHLIGAEVSFSFPVPGF